MIYFKPYILKWLIFQWRIVQKKCSLKVKFSKQWYNYIFGNSDYEKNFWSNITFSVISCHANDIDWNIQKAKKIPKIEKKRKIGEGRIIWRQSQISIWLTLLNLLEVINMNPYILYFFRLSVKVHKYTVYQGLWPL